MSVELRLVQEALKAAEMAESMLFWMAFLLLAL
jgi:hypothetical protein